jgi:hypothetical protein
MALPIQSCLPLPANFIYQQQNSEQPNSSNSIDELENTAGKLTSKKFS